MTIIEYKKEMLSAAKWYEMTLNRLQVGLDFPVDQQRLEFLLRELVFAADSLKARTDEYVKSWDIANQVEL